MSRIQTKLAVALAALAIGVAAAAGIAEIGPILAAAGGVLAALLLAYRLSESQQQSQADLERAHGLAAELTQELSRAQSERERLEVVLSSMVEGVLVLRSDGRIALANPRLQELFAAWGDLEGRLPLEAIRNPDVDAGLQRVRSGESPVVVECEVAGEAGEIRTLLMHAVIFEEQGAEASTAGSGIVAVFHDVSEIRQLEQVRRDFVASASHELRTPLTSIRGFADTLRAHSVSEDDLKRHLEAIVRNANRLENLVGDMLELSRIESRRVPLKPGRVDVAEMARVLIEDLGPRLRDAQLEAQLDTSGATGAWADRHALEQVLSNLMDNAVKLQRSAG